MREWWRMGSANRGRMSSNRIPLVGKSGNWRIDCFSFTLRLASSVAEEEWVEANRIEGISEKASKLSGLGWAEIQSGMLKRGRKEGENERVEGGQRTYILD